MARPINADPAATRARIQRAAGKLFARHGAAGASMRAIARDAQVSLATVHHHFGNKDGLYTAVVDGMYAEVGALRAELAALAETGPPNTLLEQAVRRAFQFALTHRETIRFTTRHAIDAGQVPAERQRDLLVPGLDEGVQLLALVTGQPERELRFALRSVTYLIVRYALTDPAELNLVLGEDLTPDAALTAVEDHLVTLATTLVTGAS